MPARKSKKNKSKTKTTSGNYRRGKGHKGGAGKAGRGKRASHKKQAFIKVGKKLGKKGFKRPQSLIEEKEVINVGKINEKSKEWLEKGIIKKKNKKYQIDLGELGYDKVLGRGKVNRPLVLRAKDFSEKAKEKIKKAGGKVKVNK